MALKLEEKDKILKMKQTGASNTEIAKKLKRGRNTISRFLKEHQETRGKIIKQKIKDEEEKKSWEKKRFQEQEYEIVMPDMSEYRVIDNTNIESKVEKSLIAREQMIKLLDAIERKRRSESLDELLRFCWMLKIAKKL